MPNYLVTYAIDADEALDPEDAALYASEVLANGGARRGVYEVKDKLTGETTTVDLEER